MSAPTPPPNRPDVERLVAAGSTQYILNNMQLHGNADGRVVRLVMDRYGVGMRTAEAAVARAARAQDNAARFNAMGENEVMRAGQEMRARYGCTGWLYSGRVGYVNGAGEMQFRSFQYGSSESRSRAEVIAGLTGAAEIWAASQGYQDSNGYRLQGGISVPEDSVQVLAVERYCP